jgi:hypothetical protein
MAAQARRFPEQAVLYEGSDLFTRPAILRGMENLLVDMVERPEMAHFLIGKFTAFYAEDLARALEATGGGFQLYCEWSDYGTQGGLLISPAMWREFAGPYLKRLVDLCHSAGAAHAVQPRRRASSSLISSASGGRPGPRQTIPRA